MPTTLNSGLQLPDKGSVDWYGSMQTNYNLLDNHLENTDIHVTAEDKANWDSKQGSLSQAQLDAIAQVATNTNDIATLQSGKANASHTHSSSDITDIGDYATKTYVDNSISGLVDNAPAALDTLKELSTALNDDANFASTVATALGAKANSADLATVATSGSYNDLSNKPTINDSTITIQKNGTLVGTFTVNGSAKTIDIPVPTKTSDLTNDSNFVDTSNSAVASGITSAKVTAYDSHVADTDIHVTTTDKTKWNNGVSQSYVFRYSGTAITDNSTIAYSTIDNTDNIKSGDKILDVDGKLFEITAVDTTNQTVTVGSALIDLALDANVVHTSGSETVGGFKQFANIRVTNSIKGINLDSTTTDLNNCYSDFAPYGESKGGNIQYYYCNADAGTANISNLPEAKAFFLTSVTTRIISNSLYVKQTLVNSNNKTFTRYCNNGTWGSWVNETDKYATIDTAQTITEIKTFTNTIKSQKEIELTGSRLAYILPEFSASYSGLSLCTYDSRGAVKIGTWKVDDNDNTKHVLDTSLGYLNVTTGEVNSVNRVHLTPRNSTDSKLGDSTNKWKEINGLTPSSLSMPSNTGYVDITGYFTNIGDGQTNSYTASVNGWIYLNVVATRLIMQIRDSNDNNIYADMRVRSSDGTIYMTIPIGSGNKLLTQWFTSSSVTVTTARFIPCQGNI